MPWLRLPPAIQALAVLRALLIESLPSHGFKSIAGDWILGNRPPATD